MELSPPLKYGKGYTIYYISTVATNRHMGKKSIKNIIHKGCLRMIHNDYDSGFETLSKISGTSTMQIKRIYQSATEIFKTVNNLNPHFMKNIFTSKQNARVRPHDLLGRSHNTATYGHKSFKILGPKI